MFKTNYMSNFNSNFSESKFGTSLYFPVSLSNNRSLHKSIRIFPLETPHKLKRIIIKRCHNFNVYIKLLSRVIRGSRIFKIFNHKCGTVSLQNGFCRTLNASILWNLGASMLWNCYFDLTDGVKLQQLAVNV